MPDLLFIILSSFTLSSSIFKITNKYSLSITSSEDSYHPILLSLFKLTSSSYIFLLINKGTPPLKFIILPLSIIFNLLRLIDTRSTLLTLNERSLIHVIFISAKKFPFTMILVILKVTFINQLFLGIFKDSKS